MLTKEQKKKIIEELSDKLAKQKGTVLFDYTGLKVNQFYQLRKEFRENKIDCQAAKKTLFNLALGKAGLGKVEASQLPGQMALAVGYEDEIMPARLLYNFSKKHENVKMLAGFANKDFLDSAAVMALAKLPSKTELLAKLVGSIKAPISGLQYALGGNLVKLLLVFKNVKA